MRLMPIFWDKLVQNDDLEPLGLTDDATLEEWAAYEEWLKEMEAAQAAGIDL